MVARSLLMACQLASLLCFVLAKKAGVAPSGAKVVHAKTFVNATVSRGSSSLHHSPKGLLPEDSSDIVSQMRGVCESACSSPGKDYICPQGTSCSSCDTETCDINGCSCDCECETRGWMLGGRPSQSLPLCTSNLTEDATCMPNMTDIEQGGKYGLPEKGRVAVLIRGQAFRDGTYQGPSCVESAKTTQMEAVKSLNDQIINPLEARGNVVDLFVVETSGCGHQMMDGLIDQYNTGGRIKGFDFETPMNGQAYSTRYVINMFNQHKAVPLVNYSLVLMTRHDVLWRTPITEWKGSVDFRRVNFLNRCEFDSPYGEGCVNDILHMMPGSLFANFSNAVNMNRCFSMLEGRDAEFQAGFACLNEVTNHTNMSATVVTDWRPEASLRANNFDNPIAVVYPMKTEIRQP